MKKLFTNDKFFLCVTLLSITGALFYYAIMFCYYPDTDISQYVIAILSKLCTLVLYLSYVYHKKNVMKGMMGAILMSWVNLTVSLCLSSTTPADKLFYTIFMILSAALFVNHFIINADHKSKPVNIIISQVIVILYIIAVVAWSAFWIPISNSVLETIADVVYMISFACTMSVVVCVESRLDTYRTDREAAGWTEEAGYPKGYVHEYQKK